MRRLEVLLRGERVGIIALDGRGARFAYDPGPAEDLAGDCRRSAHAAPGPRRRRSRTP